MIRTFTWAARLPWVYRQTLGILLILAVAFTLAMGCYALYAVVTGAFPAEHRPVPMYEVLSFVLAIAAIGIAAFGVGAYKLLAASIHAKVKAETDKSLWLAVVIQTVDSGFLYWNLYEMSAGQPLPVRRRFLAQAIHETHKAHDYIRANLSVKDLPVLRQSIMVRNNWAYFIYEKDRELDKASPDEKAIALACVEYLEQYKTDFPEMTPNIIDTIEKVAGHFRPATS